MLAAAVAGWLSYIAQRRAYPYQRDPVLVFLLLLITLDLPTVLADTGAAHGLSLAALAWTALVFAPVSAWKTARSSLQPPP